MYIYIYVCVCVFICLGKRMLRTREISKALLSSLLLPFCPCWTVWATRQIDEPLGWPPGCEHDGDCQGKGGYLVDAGTRVGGYIRRVNLSLPYGCAERESGGERERNRERERERKRKKKPLDVCMMSVCARARLPDMCALLFETGVSKHTNVETLNS